MPPITAGWNTPRYLGVGTADYRAPEEAADAGRVDIRADIYSLGCTLYHFLAGCVPFPGGDLADKLRRHRDMPPAPLAALRDGVPPAILEAVRRMTAKAPAERFQTPAEVSQALLPFGGPCVRHILVVDDDQDARESMAAVLRTEGFRVTTSGDGRDALRQLREGLAADLVLLDLRMPVMDGWQFLQERQQDGGLAHVPVILLSGADPGQVRAFAAGAVDFLQKPVEPEALTEKLNRHTP